MKGYIYILHEVKLAFDAAEISRIRFASVSTQISPSAKTGRKR